MKVTLMASTRFNADTAYSLTGWVPDNDEAEIAYGGSYLAEFAGRACYQSWDKPNPVTATNEGYLGHILEVGHLSVLEHGAITFYIEDVSRSLTHELVRHRHLSPSQLSQRFVRVSADTQPVVPPLYRGVWESDPMEPHSETQGIVERVWAETSKAYGQLVEIWEARLLRESGLSKLTTVLRKRAREAARCVLPNMTPTAIVMTGNHRAWRHFLEMRGSRHADMEIRELAIELWRQLDTAEPNLYQDFRYVKYFVEGEEVECLTVDRGE